MDELDRGLYRGRIVVVAVFVAVLGALTVWLFTGSSHPGRPASSSVGSVPSPVGPLAVTGVQVDAGSVAPGAPKGALSSYPGAATALSSPVSSPPLVGSAGGGAGGAAMAPDGQSVSAPGSAASVGSVGQLGRPVGPATVVTAPPVGSAPVGPSPTLGWCADATMDVMARTDAPSYRMGSPARLELIVVSLAADSCLRDLGRSLRELAVTAVNGVRLWSSLDCSFDTRPDVRVLRPGSAVTFALQWVGRTSHPGCSGPRVPVGPGTYRVTARLGTRVGGSTGLIIQR